MEREQGEEGVRSCEAPAGTDDGYAYPPEAIAVLEGLPVRPRRPTFNIGGDGDPAADQAEVTSPRG